MIYVDINSPLTNAVQAMGYFALRFTRQGGDLRAIKGQRKLWSRLNMFESVALFDRISSWRQQEFTVKACGLVCRAVSLSKEIEGSTLGSRMDPLCPSRNSSIQFES